MYSQADTYGKVVPKTFYYGTDLVKYLHTFAHEKTPSQSFELLEFFPKKDCLLELLNTSVSRFEMLTFSFCFHNVAIYLLELHVWLFALT